MFHHHHDHDGDGHDDHAHGQQHDHHHDHDHAAEKPRSGAGWRAALRFGLAGLVLAAAIIAACTVMVPAGEAVVVTRFGDPVRVLTRPGLALKLPLPIESVISVDLRLRTISTGLQDVGTRDGLRILVQAYVAWQVPPDPARVRQFLRSVQNAPDEASRQLRSFVGAALQVAASSFDLADLVNTDPRKVQLDAFEAHLRDQVAAQVRAIYGVEIRQVGIERLSLPAETLAATVERMRAERETVAAERTAEGLRAAAAIRADAARDERVTVAHAEATAADIEAAAEQRAAELHASAYKADPGLYLLLRSLDSIGQVVNGSTRLILRTDAAPFNMLVSGVPPSPPAPPPPVPTPVPGPPGQVMSGTPPSGGPR